MTLDRKGKTFPLNIKNETGLHPSPGVRKSPWKVILTDDDEEIHTITRMVLKDYTFDAAGLEFYSAYSGEQAIELMTENPDTAIILLDVIMETENAGLDVVRYIRRELNNHIVQIILRTGEPGQVPEHKVVEEYEINDYKTKQELTSLRLYTTITSALRAYKLAHSYELLNQQLTRELNDKKKVEEQLRQSLYEKEILLKEVHHRVKNNMQIISSLLSLQSRYIKDPRDLELFMDSENRVRSMALVHEKLYQSGDFTRIDFESYIKELVSHLSQFYNVDTSVIRITVDVKNLFLNIEEAIPCAQIINELISNSMKYAFAGMNDGEISIRFYVNGDRRRTLIIGDTGIGLPESVDYRNTESLGLQLVNALNSQLKGSIELDRSLGTRFTITF